MQPAVDKQPAKAEPEQGAQPQEAGAREGRNRRKNYYRNRRRNRSEGAKEQHES